jgi:hypothetical protein
MAVRGTGYGMGEVSKRDPVSVAGARFSRSPESAAIGDIADRGCT